MKKVLITGAGSYVGTNVEKWLLRNPTEYYVDTIEMRDESWKKNNFIGYDVVFHVAGVAHIKETKENTNLYFKINRDLAYETAQKAKDEGVKQFIFMSTMAVYGEEGKIGQEVIITETSSVNPKTNYAKSKIEAEERLAILADDYFKIVVLRPPMIYGPDCPGNYAKLEKMALKIPVFPLVQNKRSMLQIEKLCQYIKKYIDEESSGLFFPQNDEYMNTSLLVKEIAQTHGRKLHLSKMMGWVIVLGGKKIKFIRKVFGNLIYAK